MARTCASVPLLLALALVPAHATDSMNAPALKAAFLYSFVKFVEWPDAALPPGAPIVLCIAEDAKVAEVLERATGGRDASGHPLLVRRLDPDGSTDSCHLLYAPGLDAARTRDLLAQLKDKPLLSVSDFPQFAHRGGVAHLFMHEGRMRFAVNVDAADRAGLRLSSQLLNLAVIVKELPGVTRP